MTEPASNTPEPGTVPAVQPPTNPITNFIKQEPVMIGYGVTWAFAQVGEYLIGHTHLVSNTQWDSLTSWVAPVATTFVLGAVATFTRKYVTPVIKKIDPSLFQ